MKCRKQFLYHKIPISNLWEVHLEDKLWGRVRDAAQYRRCSLCWITRYCVLRLARKKNLRMFNAMKIHSNRIKTTYKNLEHYHRHIICLYGDDEKLLRYAAMKLGVTVSHLIRLALHWFLPKVERLIVPWSAIFYHGTKICRFILYNRQNMLRLPYYESIFYGKWTNDDWWGRPYHRMNIPYTPDISYQ